MIKSGIIIIVSAILMSILFSGCYDPALGIAGIDQTEYKEYPKDPEGPSGYIPRNPFGYDWE